MYMYMYVHIRVCMLITEGLVTEGGGPKSAPPFSVSYGLECMTYMYM